MPEESARIRKDVSLNGASRTDSTTRYGATKLLRCCTIYRRPASQVLLHGSLELLDRAQQISCVLRILPPWIVAALCLVVDLLAECGILLQHLLGCAAVCTACAQGIG